MLDPLRSLALLLAASLQGGALEAAALRAAEAPPTLAAVEIVRFRDCRNVEVREIIDPRQSGLSPRPARLIRLAGIRCFPTASCASKPVEVGAQVGPVWLLVSADGTQEDLLVPAPRGAIESSSGMALHGLPLELVERGLAVAEPDAPDVYKAAEGRAREQHLGCWPPG